MPMSVQNIDLITDTVGAAIVEAGTIRITPEKMEQLLNAARRQGRESPSVDMLTAVVLAAGGEVRVTRAHQAELRGQRLFRQDESAGSILFFTQPEQRG